MSTGAKISDSIVSIDGETRSDVDLRKAGSYRYFQSRWTDIWMLCFAFDQEDVETWYPGQPPPPRLAAHIKAGKPVRGWNSGGFERIMFRLLLGPKYGWPVPVDAQWHDTMAWARAMSLPGALENCAKALRAPIQKDLAGNRLMLQMCRPRHWLLPDGTVLRGKDATEDKRPADVVPVWWDEPAKITRLALYCADDVRTERVIVPYLRPLSGYERQVWLWDQRVNDSGVLLDRPFVQAAQRVVETATKKLDQQMRKVTGGAVPRCSGVQALGTWLKSRGVELPTVPSDDEDEEDRDSLDKAAVLKLLGGELPDDARQAIELRQEAGKSSTAKLRAMLGMVCEDDRARQLFIYHGASTGRFSGTKIQLQNLTKPTVPAPESFIPDILAGRFDRIDILAPPLDVVASLLRGCFVAAPGHRFLVGDFAAIEARVVAWLAGQHDLVELFRTGGDPYCEMASKIYHRRVTKADYKERQIGKALVLGAGFQMGGPKFRATAAKPPYLVEVTEEEAIEYIGVYRQSNACIARLWRDMEDAAFDAVQRQGIVTSAAQGRIRFSVRGRFLWMILPSGRTLAYADPFIAPVTKPWGDVMPAVRFYSVPTPTTRRKLTPEDAALPKTIPGKWHPTNVFGGLWTENAVQAVARDLLVSAALRLEHHGYPTRIHAHDELVAETPTGTGSLEEMLRLMCAPLPAWAAGLPVLAEGFAATRYKKG